MSAAANTGAAKGTMLPPKVIAGLHAGSNSDFGDDVDIDDMIEKMGCSKEYYKLEDCLGETDRDWAKCQAQVKMLKQCNDRLNKFKQQQRQRAAAAAATTAKE